MDKRVNGCVFGYEGATQIELLYCGVGRSMSTVIPDISLFTQECHEIVPSCLSELFVIWFEGSLRSLVRRVCSHGRDTRFGENKRFTFNSSARAIKELTGMSVTAGTACDVV